MPYSVGCQLTSILVYKPSSLKNNTLFEMPISMKTNKLLGFFQTTYVVLFIKVNAKLAHLRLYEKNY